MLNESIANHYLFLAIFFGFSIFYANLRDVNHICCIFYWQKSFLKVLIVIYLHTTMKLPEKQLIEVE